MKATIGALAAGIAVVCVAMVGMSGTAEAAQVSCPAAFTANGTAKVHDGGGAPILTAASACQYIGTASPSTVANAANVNANAFFGFSDWTVNAGNSQVNVNALTGSWAISGVDFAAYDYMIVFKSGAGTNLTGFLLNEAYASGQWSTPFTDPPFNLPGSSTQKDVSHYTIFQRSAGAPIPAPAALAVFGVALAGLGWALRRRAS